MNKNEIRKLTELLAKGSNKKVSSYNKKLLIEYKSALKYTKDALQKLFNKLGDTPEFATAQIRLRNIEVQLSNRIKELDKNSKKITKDSIKDTYEFNYNGFNKVLSKTVSSNISFGLISKQSVNASIINPFNWEGAQSRYSRSLLEGIKSSVTQGLLTGKSYPNMLNDVTGKFNVASSDAMRILRTETHRNEIAAKIDSIDEFKSMGERLGFIVEKVWITFIDDRTRDSHIDLNEEVADENGMFNVGGVLCEGPGFSGIPEEDINCRCTLTVNTIEK